MANNRLILRKMVSPWVTDAVDITRNTTLTHVELDSNFIYLKGEVIESASLDGGKLSLGKINGGSIEVDMGSLSGDTAHTVNLLNELKNELEANVLWEAGSSGRKSIRRKNDTQIDSRGSYSLSEGKNTLASGDASHAEGDGTVASGKASHSEGTNTEASGGNSHAEGFSNVASGNNSHAEGSDNVASGNNSHAEGSDNVASGVASHAEGTGSVASGNASHAEGSETVASGVASHAGGSVSEANGDVSFVHSNNSNSDGKRSAILGGDDNFVESGGQNSGVYVGLSNRVLGVNYEDIVNKLKVELDNSISNRANDKKVFDDAKETLEIKIEHADKNIKLNALDIEAYKADISEIDAEIGKLDENSKEALALQDLRDKKESELKMKEEENATLLIEKENSEKELKKLIEDENDAVKLFEQTSLKLQAEIKYNETLLETEDNHPPVNSAIIAGKDNMIDSSSDSIVGAGSDNVLKTEVKNSGIFAGSENEISGDEYSKLIKQLKYELSVANETHDYKTSILKEEIDSLKEEIAFTKFTIDNTKKEIAELTKECEGEGTNNGGLALLQEDESACEKLKIANANLEKLSKKLEDLNETLKSLEDELSTINEKHASYQKFITEKIAELSAICSDDKNAPVDNSAIIAGANNQITLLSDNSAIVGGQGNRIMNLSNTVILGGGDITARKDNTVYTPSLNIKANLDRDNSLTQVLVRDADGYIKYKDVSSFTDLNVVSGSYDPETGTVTMTNNEGDTFEITGFAKELTDSYTTNAYIEGSTMYFDNNVKGEKFYSVDISSLIAEDEKGDCAEDKWKEYNDQADLYSEYLKLKLISDEIKEDIDDKEAELKKLQGHHCSTPGYIIESLNILGDIVSIDGFADKYQDLKNLSKQEGDGNIMHAINSLINYLGDLDLEGLGDEDKKTIESFISANKERLAAMLGYNSELYDLYIELYGRYQAGEIINWDNDKNKLQVELFNLRDTINQIINDLNGLTNILTPSDVDAIQVYIDELIDSGMPEDPALIKQIKELISLLDGLNKLLKDNEDNLNKFIEEHNFFDIVSFGAYMPINDTNFDCWALSQLEDRIEECCTGGEEEVRGKCSEALYAQYQKQASEYSKIKASYDTLLATQLELKESISLGKLELEGLMTQISDTQEQIITLEKECEAFSNPSGLALLEDPQINPCEELGKTKTLLLNLQSQLKELAADIKEKEKSLGEIEIQMGAIEESEILEFEVYMPVNEVNFDCWTENELKIDLETQITKILETIGYDSRGECSDEHYNEYKKLVSELIKSNEVIETKRKELAENNLIKTELEKEIDDLEKACAEFKASQADKKALSLLDHAEFENNPCNTLMGKIEILDSINKQIEDQINFIDAWESSSDYDLFNRYAPINEVNFICWRIDQCCSEEEEKGPCATEKWKEYTSLGEQYLEYEKIQSQIDVIDKQISDKESEIDSLLENLGYIPKSQAMLSPANIIFAGDDDDDGKSLKLLLEEDFNPLKLLLLEKDGDDDKLTGSIRFRDWWCCRIQKNPACCYLFGKKLFGKLQNIGGVGIEPDDNIFGAVKGLKAEIDSLNKTSASGDGQVNIPTEFSNMLIELTKMEEQTVALNSQYFNSIKIFEEEGDAKSAYTNPKISGYLTDLDKGSKELQTQLDSLPDGSDTNGQLQKLINDLSRKETEFDSQLTSLINDLDDLIKLRDVLIESLATLGDVSGFGAYMPINDTNFDCWALSQLEDRIEECCAEDVKGECASEKYASYKKQALEYEERQQENLVRETELNKINNEISDKENQLAALKAELLNCESQGAALALLEDQDPCDFLKGQIAKLEAEIKALKASAKSISDEIKEYNDSGAEEWLNRFMPINEVNFDCWTENELKIDLETQITTIIDEVGYNNRGTCSSDKYKLYQDKLSDAANIIEKQGIIDDCKDNIVSWESTISDYEALIAKLSSQIPVDVSQIAVLKSNIDELKKDINSCKENINTNEKEIRGLLESSEWADITEVKSFISAYGPDNEVNFDCWSEQQIIDKVGYENRGECSNEAYATYLDEAREAEEANAAYEAQKADLERAENELSDKQTRLAELKAKLVELGCNDAQNSDGLKLLQEPDTCDDIIAQIQLLENEIKADKENIKSLNNQIKEHEASDAYIFNERYMPVNEVNFICWENDNIKEQLDRVESKIDECCQTSMAYDFESALTELRGKEGKGDANIVVGKFPKVYEAFEANPKFIMGDYDELVDINSSLESNKDIIVSMIGNDANLIESFNNTKVVTETLMAEVIKTKDETINGLNGKIALYQSQIKALKDSGGKLNTDNIEDHVKSIEAERTSKNKLYEYMTTNLQTFKSAISDILDAYEATKKVG